MLNVLEKQDKIAIYNRLATFKDRGVVQYNKLLSLPQSERIAGLIHLPEGRKRVAAVLTASIGSAMSNLNLRIGLNEDQVVEIAVQIIDQAEEDYLSLEDVLLFLQQLITGQMGKIYDRMDIPTFFELFEVYRQDRHEALMRIRYEQQANHKALGPTERASEDITSEKDAHRSALNEHMKNMYKNQSE